ncbi:hypothetical protein MCP1_240037 [Candidatus Terasakiella magnetica]|nr:hypothetical protein MCP1_240037 [Candidatus Terasakiella magnetica]
MVAGFWFNRAVIGQSGGGAWEMERLLMPPRSAKYEIVCPWDVFTKHRPVSLSMIGSSLFSSRLIGKKAHEMPWAHANRTPT